jgi:MFS family permease
MSAIEAGRHASLTIVCSAVSLIVYAALSDRIGLRRPLIMVSALLYLLCWGAWLLGVPRQWTYAMAGAMGVVMTGFSLAWACAKEVNRPRYAGMAVAVVNTGAFVAAGVLQPLVGWVLDRSAGGAANAVTLELFRPALLVLGGFTLIGVIGALFIRETRCRNIWSPTPTQAGT